MHCHSATYWDIQRSINFKNMRHLTPLLSMPFVGLVIRSSALSEKGVYSTSVYNFLHSHVIFFRVFDCRAERIPVRTIYVGHACTHVRTPSLNYYYLSHYCSSSFDVHVELKPKTHLNDEYLIILTTNFYNKPSILNWYMTICKWFVYDAYYVYGILHI